MNLSKSLTKACFCMKKSAPLFLALLAMFSKELITTIVVLGEVFLKNWQTSKPCLLFLSCIFRLMSRRAMVGLVAPELYFTMMPCLFSK